VEQSLPQVFLHPQAKCHVFEHGHMGKQGVALKDGINVAMFRRNVGDIPIVEFDMAHINAFQPGNQAKHSGFAAAGRAEQGEEFAVIDGQVKV
jgi:hypothetical protein